MPLLETRGAASAKGFGLTASTTAANYIEEVFSTYLYTGNGSVQTIPNGIALGTAYGGSVYFDGSGDYLTVPDNVALRLSGDFTIEFWLNVDSGNIFRAGVVGKRDQNTWNAGLDWVIRVETTDGKIGFGYNAAGNYYDMGTYTTGTWTHYAITRSGTSIKTFKNGTQVATATDSSTYTNTEPVRIGINVAGYEYKGFISNLRIIKGTAVYTSNFTPSTTPLTAVSGTSLLTCKTPNAVLDYSGNNFTITVNGNATAQNGGGPFTDATAGKGGLVWVKQRNAAVEHFLYDTARGATKSLSTNDTTSEYTNTATLTAFNSNGFTLGSSNFVNGTTSGPRDYASWTFRKQPKFFDVVTYTGNGSTQAINHSLGSTPGCIIVKNITSATVWSVWHRSVNSGAAYGVLNLTDAFYTDSGGTAVVWGNNTSYVAPTSTQFTVGSNSRVNTNGDQYVAYIFAHDAGGFGLTGTDNVITCGSFTGSGAGVATTITLGYEPQFILAKRVDAAQNWIMVDTMRGLSNTADALLYPNLSNAESSQANTGYFTPTATGFVYGPDNFMGDTAQIIYIAIRRGPMKTPTTGTSVYEGTTRNGTGAAASISGLAFPPDAVLTRNRDSNSSSRYALYDKLRGPTIYLDTAATDSEFTVAQSLTSFNQTGESFGTGVISNASGEPYINWQFRRAPGFFDVVCYTGTGVNGTAVPHNLGVAPELIIAKRRFADSVWLVYANSLGIDKYLLLNTNNTPQTDAQMWGNTAPNGSSFYVGSSTNFSGWAYVSYLFASCPGVSKVGSYTGNGSSQTINCGFTGGARFVLIKRTDSTGNWVVFDSARGIVAGNDPFLELNTTAAEQTGQDAVDADSTGFIVNQNAANINVGSGTYIYLAIA